MINNDDLDNYFREIPDKNLVYTIRDLQPLENEFDHRFVYIGSAANSTEEITDMGLELDWKKEYIYVSFGTVLNNLFLYKKCIEAFRDTKERVIISDNYIKHRDFI